MTPREIHQAGQKAIKSILDFREALIPFERLTPDQARVQRRIIRWDRERLLRPYVARDHA